MEENKSKENNIKILSRVQTAKIRQNLEKTFFNIKTRKQSSRRQMNSITRPITSFHDDKLSQLYLPPCEYDNDIRMDFKEKDDYQKAHLNEVNIQNLFTEKLWEKNNIEKNEDYTKKIAYKKLIMRARLLKAMKTNIVLRQYEFDEYNSKYYQGIKLLSDKLKNKERKVSNDISSENENDLKEKPNFVTIKNPDIFSEYEYTSLFQDYFCTPIDLIKKIFDYDEQKLIKLDPIYFRLNKGPFIGLSKKFGFGLKDKINEEDKIEQEKIEKMKKLNKRFVYVKRKHTRKSTDISNFEIKNDYLKENKDTYKTKTNFNNKKKPPTQTKYYFPKNKNTDNKNKNNKLKTLNNFFPSSKSKKSKKTKKLKLDLSETKNNRNKNTKFNFNTDYNVYLEIKKNQKKKKQKTINYFYSDEEKIKDKKKRLSMEELMELYNERKKLYLEDMSYNRKKNKYRFEKLRIRKHEENQKENQEKEELRKILMEIEDNYKIYQK